MRKVIILFTLILMVFLSAFDTTLISAESFGIPLIVRVQAERGSVMAVRDGEIMQLSYRDNPLLTQGDMVITGPDAKAFVTLYDVVSALGPAEHRFRSQLVLGGNTTIVLDRLTFERTRVELHQGALYSNIGVIGETDYRIHTPLATAGVRGTEFEMEYVPPKRGEERVDVRVIRGQVHLISHTEVSGEGVGQKMLDDSENPNAQVIPGTGIIVK